MTNPHRRRTRAPRPLSTPLLGLGMGLALLAHNAASPPAFGQPPASGSGAGTGTGMSGGASRNTTGTGAESGPGFNPTGTGAESGSGLVLPGANNYSPLPRQLPRVPPGMNVPMGPGATTTFPDEVGTIPLDALTSAAAGGLRAAEPSRVTDLQLQFSRRIANPGDRSLALSRIASAATASVQLDLADQALQEAAQAALQMPRGLVQDQRLISIILALTNLGDARLREGKPENALPDFGPEPRAAGAGAGAGAVGAAANAPAAAPAAPRTKPADVIRAAIADYRRAGDLARRMGNVTYRSEYTARVVETMGYASQTVVNEYPQGDASRDASGLDRSYEGLPDLLLQDATSLALRDERPVWRDQALVRVATSAAESRQYSRALAVARQIPNPEPRTSALLKLAEIQARRGDPNGATASYREAALAVASIPQDDPRAVLAGVLIDNLVSLGRFEDARASLVLYPDEPRRVVAMSTIAESMGRRGAGLAALQWINTGVAPAYRSLLYRHVNNGLVAAIESNRARELNPSRDFLPGPGER